MFKKIDWYIIKGFLVTFFFAISLLMTISVVFDISEKLDDFLRSNPSFKEIALDYYLNFVLAYSILFSPLIIFVALIFFTSKMAQRTEVVAILSSGVSFNRYLRPYFIAASILAFGALYVNHFVIPKANAVRLNFEEKYYRNPYSIKDKDIHFEIEEDRIVYFKTINLQNASASNFSIEQWKDEKLISKLSAKRVKWDSTNGVWNLTNYTHRNFLNGHETLEYGNKLDTNLNIGLSDFGKRIEFVSSMNYYALNEFIEKERKMGSSKISFYLIEKYQRTSYPFATYVLTLIGVSLASRKVRGGIGMHLALGFLVVLTYIFAMKVTTVSATNAGLSPFIAVWIPNVLFSILAIYLYIKSPK
ncbi:MAG: lipopolysaccharide export system permease protein [Patiriisocius sp.]|jgi:lipopolysaccharide export system permease protein